MLSAVRVDDAIDRSRIVLIGNDHPFGVHEDLAAGEEICVSYFLEETKGAYNQAKFLERFWIDTCLCAVCVQEREHFKKH